MEVGVFGQPGENVAEVAEGVRDRLQEMGFAFVVATEAVGAEHLEGAEEDEMWESLSPSVFSQTWLKLTEFVEILVDEAVTEFGGEVSTGLPEEGGDVVLGRAASSALEIDEPGLTVTDHDVAALEVAVKEGRRKSLVVGR